MIRKNVSLSMRRAWIEILSWVKQIIGLWSLSMRRAWIEIRQVALGTFNEDESLSMRRAWIEISHYYKK